jgi:GNAT superfamily N-acetyltransferase
VFPVPLKGKSAPAPTPGAANVARFVGQPRDASREKGVLLESVPCGDMTIRLQFDTAGVDWAEAAEVLRRAPLVAREPGKLGRACDNSYVVCFAFDGETLVGMGRAISDGEYVASLFDLVVLPEYQGKGIGTAILEALHERLPVKVILLYSVPGKELFYQKFGYHCLLTGMIRSDKPEGLRAEGYIV